MYIMIVHVYLHFSFCLLKAKLLTLLLLTLYNSISITSIFGSSKMSMIKVGNPST